MVVPVAVAVSTVTVGEADRVLVPSTPPRGRKKSSTAKLSTARRGSSFQDEVWLGDIPLQIILSMILSGFRCAVFTIF